MGFTIETWAREEHCRQRQDVREPLRQVRALQLRPGQGHVQWRVWQAAVQAGSGPAHQPAQPRRTRAEDRHQADERREEQKGGWQEPHVVVPDDPPSQKYTYTTIIRSHPKTTKLIQLQDDCIQSEKK